MPARKLKRSEQLPLTSPYQLLLRLAAGGMGAVYLGLRRDTQQPLLAIKRPHAHLAEEAEFRKMFVQEARLAGRIQHPYAVGVLEVDETDGELLMVMSYVEGGSLGDLLAAAHEAGRRIPAPVAIRIIIDAARGLHAAHQVTGPDGASLGIVHRDISPQNILVSKEGRAAIVDFGVAKAVGLEATRTATDVLKGKTAYMAPEYIGERLASARSDVFSLGVVSWEVLANKRLFKGDDDVETMRRLMDPAPAKMLTEVTAIDVGVSALVARALAKSPERRFTSAAEFADALEAKAEAAELLARPAEVAATVRSLLGEELEQRRELLAAAMVEWGVTPPSAKIDLNATVLLPAAPQQPAPGPTAPSSAALGRTPASSPTRTQIDAPAPATGLAAAQVRGGPAAVRSTQRLAKTQVDHPSLSAAQTPSGFQVPVHPARPPRSRSALMPLALLTVAALGAGAWLALRTTDSNPTTVASPSQVPRASDVVASSGEADPVAAATETPQTSSATVTSAPALVTTASSSAQAPTVSAPTNAVSAPTNAVSAPTNTLPRMRPPPKPTSTGTTSSWVKANPYVK